MSDHPNAELIRGAYAGLTAGGGESMASILADSVKWHVPGRSRFAGDFEGRDAVIRCWEEYGELIGSSSTIDLVSVFADDRLAIAIEHFTAERNGKRYDRHDLVVYRIKDGKVAEGWVYPESQYELDDLLS